MHVITGDKPVYIDCDDTLILWPLFCEKNGLEQERIINGADMQIEGAQYLVRVLPNAPLIEFLKALKAQGCTLIVWSHGGYRWAETVVTRLGLTDLIDAVMCKPTLMLDDRPLKHLGEVMTPPYPKKESNK